jgi:hypothetical protein
MCRVLLTVLMTMAWLLASPSVQLRDSGWVEVGATPASAAPLEAPLPLEPSPPLNSRIGSGGSVLSNQPGLYPFGASPEVGPLEPYPDIGSTSVVPSTQPPLYPLPQITSPETPAITGSVHAAPQVEGFPNLQTLPILPRGSTGNAGLETSQDRVARCTQQGALNGLPANQRGTYIQRCAF